MTDANHQELEITESLREGNKLLFADVPSQLAYLIEDAA